MKAFRELVEAGDVSNVEALLALEVRFTSPVAFKPYDGAPMVAAILRAAFRVFEDFTYVREVTDAPNSVLEFTATVNGLAINGVDMIRVNADGLIDDFKVMVRPLSAATALAERMGVEFAQIAAELS
ncbi:membrane protein [Nocardioides baekrokdamisoli]|uniref:Membrane protein n=1 Tax=Nocardioides baekrokdamisoli TaxID=1804624 RepID=A0A3G9IJ31_9ACTN|nr:nuclear transport factor 2 family protein [Nocardioides baekrokdamisoli]BBH18182.1 membrane protein [Nocardioides baekrokdamisoli]